MKSRMGFPGTFGPGIVRPISERCPGSAGRRFEPAILNPGHPSYPSSRATPQRHFRANELRPPGHPYW